MMPSVLDQFANAIEYYWSGEGIPSLLNFTGECSCWMAYVACAKALAYRAHYEVRPFLHLKHHNNQ
jgi:hypothetical protein